MVMRDHVDLQLQTPTESYLGSSSSGSTWGADPSPSSSGGSVLSSSSAAHDREDIMRAAQAVPSDWLLSGSVVGYSQALGPFEVVAESSGPAIVPHHTATPPVRVLSIEPACVSLASSHAKLQLVCQLSPGDPIVCMQDGQRVPIRVLHMVQLDTSTGEPLHQVIANAPAPTHHHKKSVEK